MNKELVAGLVWVGGTATVALGAIFALRLGYIDFDKFLRVVIGINGLMIAWYGNRMPKAFVPRACVRQAMRVGGWSMVLSGLVYAAVWAFAPIQTALTVGCGAVIAGMAVTVGYCLSLRARVRAA
jgi:hypothetical protein